MLANRHAGPRGGDAQRRAELAVVDLMVLGAEQRAGDAGREMRLAPSRLGPGNPFARQAEAFLKREAMLQPRLVVGREREEQRAFVAQVDSQAGGVLHLARELRPQRLARAPERDQRLLARLRLGAD